MIARCAAELAAPCCRGKDLPEPPGSGLVAGRRDLTAALALHGNPHIGRRHRVVAYAIDRCTRQRMEQT